MKEFGLCIVWLSTVKSFFEHGSEPATNYLENTPRYEDFLRL